LLLLFDTKLIANDTQILPYSDLLQALEMPTIRELEDLIIDAIYLDILRGKLDQKEEQLEVEYTMGRDLEPGKLEAVLAALKDWCANLVPCSPN
jgi:COP9 signalosome complex subunit 7